MRAILENTKFWQILHVCRINLHISQRSINSFAPCAAQRDASDERQIASLGFPPRSEDHNSLVPLKPQMSMLLRLTQVAADALHNLVLFVVNLQRTDANEQYVRRVLQEQVGIDPFDLDTITLNHRYILRLSVRHTIEPVIAYLRSRRLTGSGLAYFLTRSPSTLMKDVDEYLVPLCEFLEGELGPRGMGVLVRYPQIADVPARQLMAAREALRRQGTSNVQTNLLLWQYPELYARLSNALFKTQESEVDAMVGTVRAALAEVASLQGRGDALLDAEEDLEKSIACIEQMHDIG